MTYLRALRSLRVVSAGVGLMAFPGAPALATNIAGDIAQDTTLYAAQSPYIVTSSLRVFGTNTTPVTLTIQPGVEVGYFNCRPEQANVFFRVFGEWSG